MEETKIVGDMIQSYGITTVALVALAICVVYLFKYIRTQDEKQDTLTEKHVEELKNMTDKYYESYIKVTESNAKVSEALNGNTRVLENLLSRMEREEK